VALPGSAPSAASITSRVLQFAGAREQVRFQASQAVLDLLRRTLE